MQYPKTKRTIIEIFILGAVVAKTTMNSAKRKGILADAGISRQQYAVLLALRNQNRTIAELSKILMVDPSTLVSVIDALDRKSLAERRKDPNDRRRVPISITEKGTELIKTTPAHGPFSAEDNPLVQSIEAIGEDKAQQLLTLLRELVSHMPNGEEMLKQVSTQVQIHMNAELNPELSNQEQTKEQ